MATSLSYRLLDQLLCLEEDRLGVKTLEWNLLAESTTPFSVRSPFTSVLIISIERKLTCNRIEESSPSLATMYPSTHQLIILSQARMNIPWIQDRSSGSKIQLPKRIQ
jgi:hypothetical protein